MHRFVCFKNPQRHTKRVQVEKRFIGIPQRIMRCICSKCKSPSLGIELRIGWNFQTVGQLLNVYLYRTLKGRRGSMLSLSLSQVATQQSQRESSRRASHRMSISSCLVHCHFVQCPTSLCFAQRCEPIRKFVAIIEPRTSRECNTPATRRA